MSSSARTDEILDVAVVGAGVSGIYSAWRLLTAAADAGPPPKIEIFESDDRIGGRLLSLEAPRIPNTRVELGGMRYTTGHARVKSLLHHLNIASTPFPVHQAENIIYLRGHRLRYQDLTNPDAIPYNLLPDERTPATLAEGFIALAAQRSLRIALGKDLNLKNVDLRQVAASAIYEGRSLRDLPLRFLLQRCISDEALRFADDSSGYDRILTTWNAADGLPWNLEDFGRAVSYFHAEPGYDVLPRTLAKQFEAAGGRINLGLRLASFDQVACADGTKVVALTFATNEGAKHVLLARKLILAMPRRSLELLSRSGAVLAATEENRRVHDLIGSVTPIPLFKLAICYPFPWWETIDPVIVSADGAAQWTRITKGQSITDLPIRQCYYWAVNPETQDAVLLIYDDGQDLDYWAGLRDQNRGELFEDLVPSSGSVPASDQWSRHRAPELMVREAHRQLLEMHGVGDRLDIPQPYAAAYRDWGEDPYGGGANYWHLHVNSAQVSREILQPKPPVQVFICGEAYSHNQGWVEGALETADQMLELHFGLSRPSWLDVAKAGVLAQPR
jgi:hypothetical protein